MLPLPANAKLGGHRVGPIAGQRDFILLEHFLPELGAKVSHVFGHATLHGGNGIRGTRTIQDGKMSGRIHVGTVDPLALAL